MSRHPILRFWYNVLFWSFGRGTWQYDVLCGTIIAFLLLTPTPWFYSGAERFLTAPSEKVVGLQKIDADVYVLLVLDSRAEGAMTELEKRLREFDEKTHHLYKHKAIYDDNGWKLGYVLMTRQR